jgi:acetyl esterase/lipase
MIIAAYILSFLCLALNLCLFVRLKVPAIYIFAFLIQPITVAITPFLLLLGLVGAGLGWLAQAPIAVAAGLLGALLSAFYIAGVNQNQPVFEPAFGKDWKDSIPPSRAARMLKTHLGLGWPRTPEPRWERDLPFWTIAGTDRKLLCDVWQPAEGVARSGLAFIFLHGSAWWVFDKDLGTRPLFRQLTAQGHVIMDVAYRLCPEVDIYEMLGDVKRAIVWMKTNAARYGVDPGRIVVGGGSAGGHLALLAAYAPQLPRLTPAELQGCDLSVRAVVSLYGPTDMKACYRGTRQERAIGLPKVEVGLPGAATMKKEMTRAGRIDTLLGGHLHEVPEIYELASPVTHVHQGCPPTLLIQGDRDVITSVDATREMYRKLVECGVPAVNVVYPLTNHMFEVVLPQMSPPARAELYCLERFLALVAGPAATAGLP